MFKKICVSIVNYNGSEDTIECIEAIRNDKAFSNTTIFIYDNNSEESKISILRKYIEKNFLKEHYKILELSQKSEVSGMEDIVLFLSDINNGFAKGNNFVCQVSIELKYEYSVLINNDTWYEGNLLYDVCEYLEHHREIGLSTVDIRYYSNRNIVWNAGGKVFGGYKRYYTTRYIDRCKQKNSVAIRTEFVSGCFLFVRNRILDNYGMLSERFFFGEEDYEFSYRMKHNHIKAVTYLRGQLFHKVNKSISKVESKQGKMLVYDLNKLIDMRNWFYGFKWIAFKYSYRFYILLRFFKRGEINCYKSYIKRLDLLLKENNEVDRNLTLQLWRS